MSESQEELTYPGSIRRSISVLMDVFIVGFLRIFLLTMLGKFWVENQIEKFRIDFKNKFEIDVELMDKYNPEYLQFLSNHSLFKVVMMTILLVVMSGALYYAFFNSSSWSATIGKRVMKIVVVKNTGRRLTFFQALSHYLLSLVPWLFILYIILYTTSHGVTIYQALVDDWANLFFGIISVMWVQIHIFTKRRVTAHDMIMDSSMADGRVGGVFPKLVFDSKN